MRVGLRPSERQAISSSRSASPRPAQRHSQQAVDDEQAEHYQQQRHQVEENHPVGGIVFDAEEVAEGIPAAFAGAAAKFEAKEGRFRDLADAVRPAGDLRYC